MKSAPTPLNDRAASRYIDPTGELGNRAFRLGEWYVRHKILLAKMFVAILIVWSAGSLGWSLFKWGEYLFVGLEQDKELARELARSINYTRLRPVYAPQELQAGEARVFQSGGGVYTLAAVVLNPNRRHLAVVRYRFAFEGGQTDVEEAFILPGQERILPIFGAKGDVFPAGIRLQIAETRWRRIDPHQIPDPAAFMAKRLDIGVENFSYTQAGAEAPAPSATFTVVNRTPYGFWQAEFLAELLLGDGLVDLAAVTLDNFRPGESRPVDIRLFGGAFGVSDVRLIPTMNVFDQSVYLPPAQ